MLRKLTSRGIDIKVTTLRRDGSHTVIGTGQIYDFLFSRRSR